jgi:uncharacterized heparinase superfamily protein
LDGADRDFQTDRTRNSGDDAALWRRFRGVDGEDAKISIGQRAKFGGAAAQGFGIHLKNLYQPDTRRGEAIMDDIWRIGMERVTLEAGQSPWGAGFPSKHFADRLHRFAWLPDLFAQGPMGEERARYFVDTWIESYGKFNGFAWRAGPLSARLWAWMRCGGAVFDQGDEDVRRARMDSFNRQIRYLETTIDSTLEPKARWMGACVLLAASVCLNGARDLEASQERLETEVTAQILLDGGHVSRSPSRGLYALLSLLTLKDLLQRADKPVPDFFEKYIPRMGAMVNFFRPEDGALNVFNDGDETLPETVSAALNLLEEPARRFTVAPKSGFQKLEKSGLRLVLDCGQAPPRPFGDFAHAGALGFELSDGPARLVSSCGYSAEVNVDWQAAVRRTGAHSTLVLGGRDSARFEKNDATRLLAPNGPEGISAKRLEEADEIWLDAQHGGYKAPYGLLHRRRLFMAGDGSRLTGEDSLVRPISQGQAEDRHPIGFEIRFHLHPTVTAMMGSDAIRLICADGRVWRFRTSHAGARLEKTVYLARGTVEQPEQIVIVGMADPNGDGHEPPNCVRWAFLRESVS